MTRIQRHPGEVPYLLGRVTAGDRKTLSSLVRLGLYVGALAFGGQGNISTQIFVSECESPVCGWGRALAFGNTIQDYPTDSRPNARAPTGYDPTLIRQQHLLNSGRVMSVIENGARSLELH